jgi:RNA polymerase sigma-70 factor (ECF subfamily)
MADSPPTRPSLLVRIRDPRDGQAWAQFVAVYAPLVYAYGRRQGLQDADAADLTQDSLRVVSEAIRSFEYDPQRGSFRGWLLTVVRNRLHRLRARRSRPGQGSGDTGGHEQLAAVAAPEEAQDEWDREYQRRRFRWAADQVRGQVQDATWQAFWRTAVAGTSGQVVALELGMTVAAVYLAKSRVMARLKDQLRQLQDE